MRGALLPDTEKYKLRGPLSQAFGLEKIWAFFHPTICLLSSSVEFPLNQPVVGFCGCVRKTVSIHLSLREGGKSGFFLAASSKEMVCFPWVSDCSGPVECKHAVMCGVALDAVDPLQAISGPWGLRFDSTVLSLCSVFHPLKFPLSSPPLPWWNWHFSVSSILSRILEAQLFLPDGNLWLWHEESK